MDLDRGVLARIDRNLLAGLGQDETYRMVRVPATAAKWATWKRYCDSAGISMGRAIVALINRELASVVEAAGDDSPVLAQRGGIRWANRGRAFNGGLSVMAAFRDFRGYARFENGAKMDGDTPY